MSMIRSMYRRMIGVKHTDFKSYYAPAKGKGKNKSRGFRINKSLITLHKDLAKKAKKAN